ncbi:M20 family metallopeptidase [Mesorhizobium sp. SB112]|uniref:M20 family metallopeptidase n=1 Tax=Mesorhizobium sp. SB112 TaxID=3151853 RepID=UPI003264851A
MVAFQDANALLAGLRRWVEIDTPTGDAAGMDRLQDLIECDFQELGGHCKRIPGRDGLGGHLKVDFDGGPLAPILIVAHLDTVCQPGYVQIQRDGDRFFGPGAADMKGGGYLAYAAIAQIIKQVGKLPRPVTLIFNGDEEIGSPTSRDLICEQAREFRYSLVPEPARDDEVITFRKGRAKYLISAYGRAAHAGSAFADGRNAIVELARHLLELNGFSNPATGTTVNVGTFQGGIEANVVAASAQAWVDVRFEDNAEGQHIDRAIRCLVPSDGDYKLQIEGEIEKPCLNSDKGPGSLFAKAREIARGIGIDLLATRSGGGSDGNFTSSVGTPTLDGLGVIGNEWHSPREHILISALPRREALLRQLLLQLD